MNYLEKIKPFRKHLELFEQRKGAPNYEMRIKLSDIYDELRLKESVRIYGKQKRATDIPKTDLGCNACVKIMLHDLYLWINEYEKKDTVEFKGVPQKASEPIKKLKPTTTEREIPIDITKLSWAKFKQYCKQELGLKVHGKKRAELMEEIELMNM
jgi:hypothetical protein